MSTDMLSPRQFWGNDPEQVRVSALMPHREWEHGPGFSRHAITGEEYPPKRNPAEWHALVSDIRARGIQEPVKLNYNPKTGHAMIGEGNSRLAAAAEAGLESVPVTGWRNRYVDTEPQYKVPGQHRLGEGHFPQDFKVSGVLPPEYMAKS